MSTAVPTNASATKLVGEPPQAAILIVDDHPANLLALEAILAPSGYQLVRATSGKEALERAAEADFAVILLNVNMPDHNGFQTAELLRALPRTRRTPIIFVSAAASDPEELRKGYRYGAVDFLVRPLVPEILRAKVAVFVELSLQREQLEQRKAVEVRLRETQARLTLALEAGRLGTWEWSLVTNHVSWSPVLETIHGIPVGSFDGTYASYQAYVHPDDRAHVASTVANTVHHHSVHHLAHRIIRPSGEVRWIEASGQLVLDPEGRPVRLIGVCHDVTERHNAEAAAVRLAAEEAARKAEEKVRLHDESLRAQDARHAALRADVSTALGRIGDLRQLLQSSCESMVKQLGVAFARIWTMSADDQTLELQASAGLYTHIDGGHARVPVGKFKIGLIAEERRAHHTNDVAHDERVGDPTWAAAAGLVAFAGYPLLVENRCVGVVAMFAREEISESTLVAVSTIADAIAQGIQRKHAEETLEERARELARSNAELERFAYIASHDLQEPLRMVTSYTQLLGRRYKGKLDKDADEFIAFAVDGVTRMQTLINDLLSFSRVGTKGGQMVPVPLATALATALANLGAAIKDSQAELTHDPLPTVMASSSQMVQLLQNLIGNAIKFRSDAAPRIHIGALDLGSEWQISVRDNGIGIDPEFFSRLFVIFQRLHNRSEYPGNGIGLAICKKIIERHDGRIWIESTLGQGTTFFFTLRGQKS